ncbi:MAG: ATP-binding cassette domain-containing protein [Anaerolineae bacterium]
MGPVIEVQDLVRRFGDLSAVDEVSFSVEEGEIFGFLGPNGAGKTTTINVLCTLLKPSAGTATVNGFDVSRQQADVRRSIGLVFQDPSLDERLTAEENITFHAILYGVPRDQRRERQEKVLRMVELWERRRDPVETFSGGMKRRLEIARGLMHHPKVLFLDEPTLGLDPQTRQHLWRYILDLREREGITIFLTTHYMDEAENAGRIAIIDYGKIVALDTPERLKDMVGGDVISVRTADDKAATAAIQERFGLEVRDSANGLRLEVENGERFIPRLVTEVPAEIEAISLRRPTLDDVFLKVTGHQIREEDVTSKDRLRERMRRRVRMGFGR